MAVPAVDPCMIPSIAVACLATSVGGSAASQAGSSVLSSIADLFVRGAQTVLEAVFTAMSAATRVDLTAGYVTANAAALGSVALVVIVGLFVVQVVGAAVRREPGGLGRALLGAGASILGTAAAATVSAALLAAVDGICDGIATLAGTSIEAATRRLLNAAHLADLATTTGGPVLMILFALLFIVGAVLTLGTLLVRQALIVVSVVLAPLAFAGGTARATTGWVRRWVQVTLALILSKLAIVLVFVIAVGMLGQATGLGALLSGLILLLMSCLSPWACFKVLDVTGAHVAAEMHRATTGATVSAARQGQTSVTTLLRTVAPVLGPGAATGAAAASAASGTPRPPSMPMRSPATTVGHAQGSPAATSSTNAAAPSTRPSQPGSSSPSRGTS